ncbi:unnamed protein product [Fusarium equiseti]|uniref:CCHC-type domain-containing protein n=1 Tax=Fusarium equiseti TaxID=61235 RepID=A0A8J2NQ11_FUSEQ|nr:unnamed protein product [Fusarium equiseti]
MSYNATEVGHAIGFAVAEFVKSGALGGRRVGGRRGGGRHGGGHGGVHKRPKLCYHCGSEEHANRDCPHKGEPRPRSVGRDAQQAPAAPPVVYGYRAIWDSTIGGFAFVPSSAPAQPGPAQQHVEATERQMLDAEERAIEERMADLQGRLDEIRSRQQELDQQEQAIESETEDGRQGED